MFSGAGGEARWRRWLRRRVNRKRVFGNLSMGGFPSSLVPPIGVRTGPIEDQGPLPQVSGDWERMREEGTKNNEEKTKNKRKFRIFLGGNKQTNKKR